MQLTQKESGLIKDLKGQEELCIQKYSQHAESAHDPQLKQLFQQIADVERQHLNTLNQIESGTTPSTSGSPSAASTKTFTATYGMAETAEKKHDQYLCSDLLTTEKHAAGLYNISVFEFGQGALRQTLNHIQTEEQGHGDQIYQYMKANSMYS